MCRASAKKFHHPLEALLKRLAVFILAFLGTGIVLFSLRFLPRSEAAKRANTTTAWRAYEFIIPSPECFGEKLTLWATWYWTPAYSSKSAGGVELLDANEKPLGVMLNEEEFCHAAVQGSVRIGAQVYNYDKQGAKALADCSKYRTDMPHAPYVRFQKSDSPFGEGEQDFWLVPYRSVAVDPKFIAVGTALYIPEARGVAIVLPDGRKLSHDGYFFASDTGFGVDGNHIDVFNGVSDQNPFLWVASAKSRTFIAYKVQDSKVIEEMKNLHLVGHAIGNND